jgi:hypothetical protein
VEVPGGAGELGQRVGSDRGFGAGEPGGNGAPGYPIGGDSGHRAVHFVGGDAHGGLEARSLQQGRCRRRKKNDPVRKWHYYVFWWKDKTVQKKWLTTKTLRTLLLGIDGHLAVYLVDTQMTRWAG